MSRQRKSKSLRRSHFGQIRNCALNYNDLEERRLLALSSFFGSGVLTVSISESMDVALISQEGGDVTVNGEFVDGNLNEEGIQRVAVSDVASLNVNGFTGVEDITAQLDGDFNSGSLESVVINNINQLELLGNYALQTFDADLVGAGSQFFGDGNLMTTGNVFIQGNDTTDVMLLNPANDFGGAVSIQVGGEVSLVDANDLVLGDLESTDAVFDVGGVLTDTPDSQIGVRNMTRITAGSVDLGNNGGELNLFAVRSDVDGNFAVNDIDSLVWSGNSTVGSAEITAADRISAGRNANITVLGDATFDSERLRLGIGSASTFDAGRINVNTTRNAFIWEDSSTTFFGENVMADLDVFSLGDIDNASETSIFIEGIASFQTPMSIFVGVADGDTFDAGELRFFGDTVSIGENSATEIGGLANLAQNLIIESTEQISDSDDAFFVVVENATFISENAGATLGDSDFDFVQLGTVSFQVAERFELNENTTATIASSNGFVNLATSLDIFSVDDVINADNAIVNVSGNALFSGDNVEIGQAENDDVRFGTVTFVTNEGNTTINENDDVVLAGISRVGGDLIVNSVGGSISDADQSFLTTAGQGSFFAPTGIVLGDLDDADVLGDPGDSFDVGTLQVISDFGDVEITQNGDIVFSGENRSLDMRLNATGNAGDVGVITNEPGVNLEVLGNLFLNSIGDVDLGFGLSDSINFDNLNFNSLADVAIIAAFEDEEDAIFIFGTSNNPNQAAEFRLTTNVDVFDGTNAVIEVDEFFRIEARNINLGDSETDCLMIPVEAEFETSSGNPANIETDEVCP